MSSADVAWEPAVSGVNAVARMTENATGEAVTAASAEALVATGEGIFDKKSRFYLFLSTE